MKTLTKYIVTVLLLVLFTTNFKLLAASTGDPDTKSFRISGKIVEHKSGIPLYGANVVVTGTMQGCATGMDGDFKIEGIRKAEVTLGISMIGYKSENITINLLEKESGYEFTLLPSLLEMGTVVITGTNSRQLYEDASVKTEIVTKKLIQQQGACNLAQSLGLQTGVMVENDCNNCNFTQVRILGFDGKYSQILIDGDPVVSSLGGVYGLEHYPQEMIEQIEIVKGGGSALYGAGAVAGTINMITKRPAFNRSRIGFSGNSADGAYDQQIGAVAELVSESGNSGLFIFGSTRSRSPYDRNKDGFTDLGKLDNETIGVNSFFRPFDGSELDISFHRIFEDRRGGSDMEKPVHEARVAEWTKHYKWGGKIKWNQNIGSDFRYSINYAFSLLKRDSYYGGLADDSQEARLQALGYYGFSENPLHTGGAQFQYLTSGHSFTGGIQYNNDKLLDQSVSSAAYYVDEVFENLGVFFQDEFSLGRNNELNLVAGVRLDKHSALENWIISPRISLKYQIFESLKFRAGYTSGFKAPQIFDEDLHICGLEGTQRVIRNAAGLREERSSTLSAGIEFLDFVMEIPVMLGITAFHTGLNDAYADELVSKEGNIEFWERVNSSGAYVRGLEIDFGVKPVSKLEVRAGLTIKENKYNDPVTDFNTTEFLRTPDHFGFVRVSWELENGFSFFGSMKYSGSMYVPHEIVVDYQNDPLLELVKSQSFVEFDLSVSKTIEILPKTNTIITVGVKNLTDAFQSDLDFGISKDPGYVYGPGSPRTYFVNVNLNL